MVREILKALANSCVGSLQHEGEDMDVRRDLRDDPTIPDAEPLYRGVHWNHVKGGAGIASAAFISRTDPYISVDLGSLSTPEETHGRRPGDAGVARLLMRTVRTLTPGVARDPIEGNPAHALIIPDFSLSRSKQKEVARRLARACVWAIPPSGNQVSSSYPT